MDHVNAGSRCASEHERAHFAQDAEQRQSALCGQNDRQLRRHAGAGQQAVPAIGSEFFVIFKYYKHIYII